MEKIILLILFLLPGISFSQSSWQWVNPKPDGYSVVDVKFINEFTGYQLCPPGMIRKTTDGGNNWFTVYFGKTTDDLGAFSLAGSNSIFAHKFFSNLLLKSSNGGLNWTRINIDTNYVSIWGLMFVNENTGYVGGFYQLYKTTNSGFTWESILGQDSIYGFDKIQFINQNTGYVNSSFNRRIYRTTNGGSNWNYYNWPFSIYQLNDLHFIDSETGYISTSHGMWKTTNSGQAFLQINLEPYPIDSFIGRLYFIDQFTGFTLAGVNLFRTTNSGLNWTPFNRVINEFEYVTGPFYFNQSGTGWAFGSRRKYKTIDLGETWTPSSTGFIHGVIKSDYHDTSNFFILAHDFNIYSKYFKFLIKSTDGGNSWQKFIINNTYSVSEFLPTFKFLNESIGFFISDTILYRTSNGGSNWNVNFHNNNYLLEFDFINLNTGFIMDIYDKLYRTTDSGNNWDNIYTFSSPFFSPYKIKFINENTGFVADYFSVYKSTNGGLNWSTAFSYPFASNSTMKFHFLDEDRYFFLRYNDLYRTNNGGLNWETYPIPTAPYKSEIINNVIYLWGQLHSSQDREFFKSTNGGESWINFNIGVIPYGIDVGDIKFLNENTGYITFGNAILKTTNGGTTFINNISSNIPEGFELHQNYPNPFNPSTKIKFEIPKSGSVELAVYDITGRKITGLLNENLNAGSYEVIFNANNLSSGVYFYTLKSGNFIQSKKMLYIK